MAFSKPNFNLHGLVWTNGRKPVDGSANIQNVPSQLYIYSKATFEHFTGAPSDFTPSIVIRVPSEGGTNWIGTFWSFTEQPGVYYWINWQITQHLGFPNQYEMLYASQATQFGTLIPAVPNPGP